MDILSRTFKCLVQWLGSMESYDYAFWYRLIALYICSCLAVAFSFLQVEVRSEPAQWAICLIAAMASFSIPIYEPSQALVKTYTLTLGSLALLGSAGLLPFFTVEALQQQTRARRLSYSTILILILTHLATRRYFL